MTVVVIIIIIAIFRCEIVQLLLGSVVLSLLIGAGLWGVFGLFAITSWTWGAYCNITIAVWVILVIAMIIKAIKNRL